MGRTELARLVQIDYAREMAFMVEVSGPDGKPPTLGVVRASSDSDDVEAEFGVIACPTFKGQGLGCLLMDSWKNASPINVPKAPSAWWPPY